MGVEAATNTTTTECARERFDVAVIGAGQAGLAVGYFLARVLGLSWQHMRGSALLGWVRHDAEFIAEQIDAFAELQVALERDTTGTENLRAPRAASLAEGV